MTLFLYKRFNGDWGLGDGGLGFGVLAPSPNPKSPIPNPQSPIPKLKFIIIIIIKNLFLNLLKNKIHMQSNVKCKNLLKYLNLCFIIFFFFLHR